MPACSSVIQLLRLHPVPGFRRFPVSLVHVAELCDAMIRIAERGTRIVSTNLADATYHVAAERTIAYRELGKLAAQTLGCTGISLLSLSLGALAELDYTVDPLSRKKLKWSNVPHSTPNNSKSRHSAPADTSRR